jgi:hypothetical protein
MPAPARRKQASASGSAVPPRGESRLGGERAAARARFPGFEDSTPERVGNKFAALADASRMFPVPPAVAVPVAEFRAALEPASLARLRVLIDDVRATVGASFDESMRRIRHELEGLRLDPLARRLLTLRLDEVFGDLDAGRFAVRSSGSAEDGPAASMAGAYRSVLDVRGADAVLDAVEHCWRGYYEAPAVAARARAGDFDAEPSLAVMVQRFVQPVRAGVAFSGLDAGSDVIHVEYVEGTGDALVAGTVCARRTDSRASGHDDKVTEVLSLVRALRRHRGHDVDVEWAVDAGGVCLLQVRPVTARRKGAPGPPWWARRLYFQAPPAGSVLGDVDSVYTALLAKRGPANRLAVERGVPVTVGWLVGFTGRALADPDVRAGIERALAEGRSDECLLDLGPTLRQLLVPRAEVVDRIRDLIGADGRSGDPQAVIVRDYLRGQLGVVSRQVAGQLVVEYTPAGLLALNRGTAAAHRLVVDLRPGGTPSPVAAGPGADPLLAHLDRIAEFTGTMCERYGEVSVEWVLERGRMVFLDYSVLSGDAAPVTGAGTVISAGSAAGPLLTVADEEYLHRLSVGAAVSVTGVTDVTDHRELATLVERVRSAPAPPIVHATFPYAVLSVLIGSVAGFVFDHGSVLSHLAILLREAGVPALSAQGLDGIPDGRSAAINDGSVSVV